jgi:hypothetical protein
MFLEKFLRSMGACRGLAAALIVFGGAQAAMAQSTIFNIPTTDTVEVKKAYVEFDYFLQAPKTTGSTIQIFVPRVVTGVAPNAEAGVNFGITHIGGTPSVNQSFIQPNAKYKFYADDDKGLATAVGLIWYEPMNNRSSQDNFGLLYGNFSKKFKGSDYGPRLSFGPYAFVGQVSGTAGTAAGAIVGYEQPLHPKVSFVADWFSGVSLLGYFTPGVSITLPRSGLLNIGYSIGNETFENDNVNKNRFLFVYYGVTIGG